MTGDSGPLLQTCVCPRCGRTLPRCGTIEGRGRCVSVFRCPECVVTVDLGGEPAELPLTIATDETGRIVGPSD